MMILAWISSSALQPRLMPAISLQLGRIEGKRREADEMKLSLAISNLVDNAVKYTPEEGTVKVSLDADHQNVFISVADTGIWDSRRMRSTVFLNASTVWIKQETEKPAARGLGFPLPTAPS